MAEYIQIRNTQSPGDYVVLSAALRDISLMYPDRYRFSVFVPEPMFYLYNPHVSLSSPGAKRIVAQYPLVNESNQQHVHFLWGFLEFLNSQLGTRAVLTDFRPDLYLSEEEKKRPLVEFDKPYWVFVSGGKRDYTAKWWNLQNWQTVVDRLKSKVVMVQVGGVSHVHPKVVGAYDMVGKTSARELMRLIYHSHGVICVVTCLMHIAAAFNKPCIVVAGGREPWWWEAYTEENRLVNMRRGQPLWTPPSGDNFIPHRFLHTIGSLNCCSKHGCWKARAQGQGSVCLEPVTQNGQVVPRCLHMITPDLVVAHWNWYYEQHILELKQKTIVSVPATAAVPKALHTTFIPAKARTQPASVSRAKLAERIEPVKQKLPKAVPARPILPVQRHTTSLAVFDPQLVVYADRKACTARYMEMLTERLGNEALLVVRNGAQQEVARYCADKKLNLLEPEDNLGRARLMSSVADRLGKPWLVWLEPPMLPKPQWKARLSEMLRGYTKTLCGALRRQSVTDEFVNRFAASPWFRGKRFELARPQPKEYLVTFPARGFVVVTHSLLRELQWPGSACDDELEQYLGEAVRQRNLQMVDIGEVVES
jgi:ADP-heptose:LPS heptosyltransferase